MKIKNYDAVRGCYLLLNYCLFTHTIQQHSMYMYCDNDFIVEQSYGLINYV